MKCKVRDKVVTDPVGSAAYARQRRRPGFGIRDDCELTEVEPHTDARVFKLKSIRP